MALTDLTGKTGRAKDLAFVRDMLVPVAPTRISDNIMGGLHAKLIINVCINALGVDHRAEAGKGDDEADQGRHLKDGPRT